MMRLIVLVATLVVAGAAQAEPALRVLATFSILGDLVAQVGGERVAVDTLVGPDQDAHAFDARASDIRKLAGADLVVANGLGFDAWIDGMLASARHRGAVVVVSRGVAPLDAEHEHHDDHHHGEADPHAWLDVANAMAYVRNIEAALAARDPAGAPVYAANAAAYLERLAALDARLRAGFAALAPERRTVVTPHDAFGYFAHAYGLTFLAPAGLSNEAAPSAAAVAALIGQLRELRVPVVYLETLGDERLVRRIGRETGARMGGRLYADALAAEGQASSYVGLMEHNLRVLTAP